jgi:hypothetical protein
MPGIDQLLACRDKILLGSEWLGHLLALIAREALPHPEPAERYPHGPEVVTQLVGRCDLLAADTILIGRVCLVT